MARANLLEVGPQVIELGGGRHLRLLDVLGKGASATVYRALLCSPPVGFSTDDEVERQVAVKVYSTVASDEAEQVLADLVRTVRRLACVDHPNVACVYDCGLWRGRPFVVTELIAGVPLSVLQETYAVSKRRIPLDMALFIAAEVGEALAGARLARSANGVELGIVHQGVCAREVILSWRGEVKLTDFGASASRAATSAIRSLRGVAGRVSGMAPEVAQGSPADARSDVFSLGVLLRELFIGPRFPKALSHTEAVRHARDGYVHPITFQPHLPEGLLAVMKRALELEPELRYPSACVMAFDLRREVFAMGVGDGRYFLRRALERDWVQYADEVTADRGSGLPSTAPSAAPDERAHRTSSVVGRIPSASDDPIDVIGARNRRK
jgi:serine/threonine-protein kinase